MPKASVFERFKDGFIKILGAKEAIEATLTEAGGSGLPGHTGGPQDAYRHLLISAELIRLGGELKSRALSKANELKAEMKGEQTPQDEKMDEHNYALAIEIGKKAKTWQDVVRMAREKITEAARHGGDGKEGRAVWYNKPQPGFMPDWSDKTATPNPKGGEENCYEGHRETDKSQDKSEEQETGCETGQNSTDAPAKPGDRSGVTGDGGQPEPAAQNTGSAENSPAGRRMMSELSGGEETVEEILRKPAAVITKPEIDKIIAGDGFMARGHRDAKKTDDLVTEWFQHVYNELPPGAGEAAAEARIAVNTTPTRLAEGSTVSDAAMRIGREVLQTAPGDDAEPAILRFQESLNAMAADEKPLRLDGAFGPKTNGRLRNLIVRNGFRPVLDGVRLRAGGGFVV